MALRFERHEQAAASDLSVVDAGIDQHNLAEAEIRKVRKLAVFGRDARGEVKGGAVGRTWGLCCELQQLWVEKEARGQGVGSELLERFEQEASRRGCSLVYLDTFTFQAPQFYQKCGYRVVLETRGFTNGIVKYSLHKALKNE
jgi:GNAT superfamily N-acetyltransferase